jgi:glycosyltransferase involved in cell wall biosynthesis
MKVIHVTPVYLPAWEYGGTVRAIHGMTSALVAQGHEVEVVTTTIGTPHAASPSNHEATIDGVRVTYVPGRVCWGGAVSSRLADEVLQRVTEDSVVHVSSGWQPAFRAMFAGLRNRGRPYAYSPHGCFSPEVFAKGRLKKTTYYRLLERSHLRHAAAVVATSEMEAADLRSLDQSLVVRVVPNVCDASLWSATRDEGVAWRRRRMIADDEILILQVCRPDPIKNTSLLVDALRRMPVGRNYVLVVMGPGQSKVPAEQNLPAHVRVLRDDGANELPTVRAAYSAAQVVAVPSFYECFGNVVVEAALCSARVVASPRVGAARLEQLRKAVTSVPLEANAWCRAIAAATDGLAAHAVASRNALADVVSTERIGVVLTDIYREIARPESPAGVSA